MEIPGYSEVRINPPFDPADAARLAQSTIEHMRRSYRESLERAAASALNAAFASPIRESLDAEPPASTPLKLPMRARPDIVG